MALLTSRPKGTQDLLPSQICKWDYVEGVIKKVLQVYGYMEIRTPVFEHTELFSRSIGDVTDVVQKEMYTFLDKGDRSISLRPEGTAGVVRAVLENSLFNTAMPLKLFYYNHNCYRYEKQQAGRFREFRQFGIELFGAKTPAADAEIISVAHDVLAAFGLENEVRLELNSIGCPECRAEYKQKLVEYFTPHIDELCETCRIRLEKNPMRVLDCKVESCQAIAKNAPIITDFICPSCRHDFEQLRKELCILGISYEINPRIVRGLDYYRGTVFEFVTTRISKGTVCGGGRYDGLVELLGGNPLAGIGFGLGLERLIMVLEAVGFDFPTPRTPKIYIGTIGDMANEVATTFVRDLRKLGYWAEKDIVGRNVKPQMKYADKMGAEYVVILGDDEVKSGACRLKRMSDGSETDVLLCALIQALLKN